MMDERKKERVACDAGAPIGCEIAFPPGIPPGGGPPGGGPPAGRVHELSPVCELHQRIGQA